MRPREISSLLFATTNQGKLKEVRELLADLPVELRSLADFPAVAEPEETELTFAGNSALKAAYYAQHTGSWTIADDSGLEVTALGNAPGVFSARFGGDELDYPGRIALILAQLEERSATDRSARFVCVVSLSDPTGDVVRSFTGKVEGRIADAPRGWNGFGYDPVFCPDGYDDTFGVLPAEVKNQISHRGRALALFRAFLLDSRANTA